MNIMRANIEPKNGHISGHKPFLKIIASEHVTQGLPHPKETNIIELISFGASRVSPKGAVYTPFNCF